MRSLISDSISSEPTLFKPSFNSSNVIVPLLSVSIILNNSRKPPISSSESPSAMTYKWLKIISNSNLHKQASCNFSIKPEKLDAKNYDIIGHGEVTDLIPWNQDLKCNFFFFLIGMKTWNINDFRKYLVEFLFHWKLFKAAKVERHCFHSSLWLQIHWSLQLELWSLDLATWYMDIGKESCKAMASWLHVIPRTFLKNKRIFT